MRSVIVRRTAAGADQLDRLFAQQLCCASGTHRGYGVSATVSCQTAAENDSNCSCIFIWHISVPSLLRMCSPQCGLGNATRCGVHGNAPRNHHRTRQHRHFFFSGPVGHRRRAGKPGVYTLTNAVGSATPAPQVLPPVLLPGQRGRVTASNSAIKRKASSRVCPHVSAMGWNEEQTEGRSGLPNNPQRLSARKCRQRSPARLPSGIPGIGELMLIAMQQAPQPILQFMSTSPLVRSVANLQASSRELAAPSLRPQQQPA